MPAVLTPALSFTLKFLVYPIISRIEGHPFISIHRHMPPSRNNLLIYLRVLLKLKIADCCYCQSKQAQA